MVNILIADDNLYFVKWLINNVLNNEEIIIKKICTDGKEVINSINNNIDIVIMDIDMPKYNGIEVLKSIEKKRYDKLKESIIIISGYEIFKKEVYNNSLIYDYILKTTKMNEIVYKINRLVEEKNISNKKNRIIKELTAIGYSLSHKGTIYLIEVILIYSEKECDNLKKDIYPIISKMHHKTIHNIKCNITNATESIYYNCNSDFLKKYFGFCEDVKPNTKTIINTVLNKIKNST